MWLHRLSTLGGEFASPEREAAFQAERLPETKRQARLVFAAAGVLYALIVVSDWHIGDPTQFWKTVTPRLCVVAASAAGIAALRAAASFAGVQRIMLAWAASLTLALGFIATLRPEIAPFVILILPAVFLLALPMRFLWTVLAAAAALAHVSGYLTAPTPPSPVATFTLVAAVVAINTALIVFLARANRQRRAEWTAADIGRHANSELAESRRLFETMFKAVPVPILVSRRADGQIVDANDAAEAFFGFLQHGDPTAYRTRDLLGLEERRRVQAVLDREGLVRDLDVRVNTLDGQPRHILLSLTPIDIQGCPCIVSSLVDITERKAVEERVWLAAHHDVLTGLPNRALFQTTLDAALSQVQASGARLGLILLDLDAFKEVNDTLGHEVGDALLKEIGGRLARVLAPGDFVARLGGDEFVVVAHCEADARDPSLRIHALAEMILDRLNDPMAIDGRIMAPRASLGLALFPEHAGNAADLFTNADLALYAAKGAGRNRASLFVPTLRANIEERVTIAREMRTALDVGGLVPFYQPKVSLATGEVVGFEALARWQHPTRGLLAPAAFASVFDDPEIGIAVGQCLMRQVCTDIATWLQAGIDPGRVFVNLSSAQFGQADLAESLLEELARAGLARDRIGIEVTETVLLGGHGDRVSAVLQRLHAAGIRVALDDFGTGYASLTHLKEYPVDEIKVDRSFVRDLERDADDAAIVTAVLHLGRSLGLDVTAEGVETAAQARFLEAQGCAFAQGYLYSKPMPQSRVAWFLDHRPDRAFDTSLPVDELKIA